MVGRTARLSLQISGLPARSQIALSGHSSPSAGIVSARKSRPWCLPVPIVERVATRSDELWPMVVFSLLQMVFYRCFSVLLVISPFFIVVFAVFDRG